MYACIVDKIVKEEDWSNRASDVVDDDSSRRTSVVHLCQAVVPLLSGGVPDLELHRRVVHRQRLRKERRSDRRFLQPPSQSSTVNKHKLNLQIRGKIAKPSKVNMEDHHQQRIEEQSVPGIRGIGP